MGGLNRSHIDNLIQRINYSKLPLQHQTHVTEKKSFATEPQLLHIQEIAKQNLCLKHQEYCSRKEPCLYTKVNCITIMQACWRKTECKEYRIQSSTHIHKQNVKR